jgi:hypothetical protein
VKFLRGETHVVWEPIREPARDADAVAAEGGVG